MGCTTSKHTTAAVAGKHQESPDSPTTSSHKDGVSLANMEHLTSKAYTADHPPTHWTDTVFLIPHEWLREEMNAMEASAAALPSVTNKEDSWKAEFFATWIVDFFVKVVHIHHDNEEKIYFPFMLEHNAKIPEDRIASDHKSLVEALEALGKLAEVIVEKKGLNCKAQIAQLKEMIPKLVEDVKEHLNEEETFAPKAIRDAGITKEQNDECIQKILAAGGIEALHTELPGLLVSVERWGTEEFYADFLKDIPPPIAALANDIFVPNLKNKFHAQRDAPMMAEKPHIKVVPFDPSMLPPPPPQE